ncbi:type IV toxin-antitoxin system AbiEi family antitoxin [Sedimenticola hydrogenitrophicus]|uniref:type IV toxin-antitoxin system AbiEi family antitoxin n=1 Tax=Sedimenticola hydrogenitrophicus TaxID=2967975 RepID=UPI0021A407F5|nr:type IV toxin-antitoxin system AbiEi family antitoxin [Sedimenticola hydrogenitrophicus]
MLKHTKSVKTVVRQAADALRLLLGQVPVIKLQDVELEAPGPDQGIDIVVHIDVSGRRHALVCEVKSTGQPRHVRMALLQLRSYVDHQTQDATPIFIAPYLSPDAQTLCREQGVGFLDLEGNACLIFDGVFIERQVASKPVAERRELRSLFKPKSAQVLRVMLRNPGQAWRVSKLARTADVSLGHVSNVRSALLDREWAQVSEDGLFLSEPDALLDEWCDAYEPPAGKRLTLYTTLHGSAFEEAARQVLRSDGGTGLAVFASFSAAHWLAPYGRTGTQYFYADETGLERLQSALKLSAISKGENVNVTVLKDSGLFRDTVEPAPGAICTSPVQTYLDLAYAGERGQEAADHLRREKLIWPK